MRHCGWQPPWTSHSSRYGVWRKVDDEPLWDGSGYVWVLRWELPPSPFMLLMQKLDAAHAMATKFSWLEDEYLPVSA